MYKLVVFIPESDLEQVKTALFNAGAGRIGNYDQCCWQSLGTGQFCPQENSNPTLGRHHVVEQVSEYRVEMVCEAHLMKPIIQALRQAHSYEEPAFDVIKLDPLCYPLQPTTSTE